HRAVRSEQPTPRLVPQERPAVVRELDPLAVLEVRLQGGIAALPRALPHPDQRQERQQRRVQVGTGAPADPVHRDRQLVHAQGCPWNIRYATYPAAQATIPNPANSRIKNTVCNTPGTIPGRPAGARSEATAREPHSGEQLRNGPSAEPSNRTQRGDS